MARRKGEHGRAKRLSRRMRRAPVGARPGTILVPEDAPPSRVVALRYDARGVERIEVVDPAQLKGLRREGTRLWVDVQGLGTEAMLRGLTEVFALHPLAVEDVLNLAHRPKSEPYPGFHLYVSRMVKIDAEGSLQREQVSIVFGSDWTLTFQERYGDILDPVRKRLHEGRGPMRGAGADYVAYAIVDALIDGYFPVLEHMGELLQALEDEAMDASSKQVLARINDARRDLLVLRRSVWPQREAVLSLLRDESPLVGEQVRLYLRDCYDHCIQVSETIESYRELAGGLLNVYMTAMANRTNDVMKVLTVMASIFIPLSFLAGLYGMNFEHMPELGLRWGYPALLLVMLAVALGMLAHFRRRGWIGGRRRG